MGGSRQLAHWGPYSEVMQLLISECIRFHCMENCHSEILHCVRIICTHLLTINARGNRPTAFFTEVLVTDSLLCETESYYIKVHKTEVTELVMLKSFIDKIGNVIERAQSKNVKFVQSCEPNGVSSTSLHDSSQCNTIRAR